MSATRIHLSFKEVAPGAWRTMCGRFIRDSRAMAHTTSKESNCFTCTRVAKEREARQEQAR